MKSTVVSIWSRDGVTVAQIIGTRVGRNTIYEIARASNGSPDTGKTRPYYTQLAQAESILLSEGLSKI